MRCRGIARAAVLLVCAWSAGRCQEESRGPQQHPELRKVVRNWAQKLGGELWHFGEMVTRKNKVKESFKDTNIVVEDGEALLKDIHEKISNMLKLKVDAVKRIMDIAEEAALEQKDDIDLNFRFYDAKNLTNSAPNITEAEEEKKELRDPPVAQELKSSFISSSQYQRAIKGMVQPEESDSFQQDQDQDYQEGSTKNDDYNIVTDAEVTNGPEKDPQASQTQPNDTTKLPLHRNRHFYNIPVNTEYSAVHVPSNVYARSKDVLSGIIWSQKLDQTFRDNYKSDPMLSWQYFGSSTGFMRQFPAMIWKQEPIDLFDCRTRSWYIEAASSPKDMVILVDRSGSMTGMRREIARHVVHNILDTLGNNDYINIYTFSNTTDPLVECFDKRLVQANLANIRILKESMSEFKTEQIANFSLALITAFELLEEYRELKQGANCNQAIMLITDGSQYNYKEIFEKYNWLDPPNVKVKVRVFTYLIGREVSDTREVKWMACANQGYYVHLSTYAEVREEVLHYIPVMARPMVLNSTVKPNPTWSPVYADVTDPKLTNWLWVLRERNRQRERFLAYRRNKNLLAPDDRDKKFVHQQKHKQDNYGDTQTYHMMTSVSLPVYDKKPRQERVANLLGVAGTDVPVEYIQKLMLSYRLGVNGYGFIVTNNGYILIHPDLRPVFEGILKPAYNRVDITEVEIMDDEFEPRQFSSEIMELRQRIIDQMKGNVTLKIKTHLDEMKRIIMSKRHYYYMGINGTPFTLVIALPHKYGFHKVQHQVQNDIHRIRSNEKKGWHRQFFTGNWTIHPDWHYCRYLDDKHEFDTPEDEFVHFLKEMEEPGWKWTPECDRKLMTNIVADAKITSWFSQNITTNTKEETGNLCKNETTHKRLFTQTKANSLKSSHHNHTHAHMKYRAELIRNYGIVVAFMATHSGLTRWQNFPQNIDPNITELRLFHILHNKAIDEVWYRRAVEHHYTDSSNFVYAVPHEIGNDTSTLVTVSHAIFKEEGSKKSPAAVVGYQFYHSNLYSLFTNITRTCGGDLSNACVKTCESAELHCLLLDDNGYIIVSDDLMETGFFFGDIRPDIMFQLVEEGIYQPNRIFDYQGLCPEPRGTVSPASKLLTPIFYISSFVNWAMSTMLYFTKTVVSTDFEHMMYPDHQINEHKFEEEHEYDQQEHLEHDHEVEPQEPPPFSREKEFDSRLLIPKTKPEPCDLEMYLYTLIYYTERNISNSGYNKTMESCERPFIVQRVIGSNMILLVIHDLCPQTEKSIFTPDPEKVDYNMSLHCYRTSHELPRRLYMSCINENKNESEIKLCGKGTNISPNYIIYFLLAVHFYKFL